MTRKKVIAIVVGVCMVVGTSAVFVSHADAQGAGRRANAHHERHPEIRRAMKELQDAKQDLQRADRDFGGHRADAVKAVDRALDECRAALKYDKD